MAVTQQPDQRQHLTEKQIRDFLEGGDQDFSDLLEHVEGCDLCEQKLSSIAEGEFAISDQLKLLAEDWSDDSPLKQSIEESLMIPQKDRFEILNEIAQGGMGVIVRANDRVLRRIVALKIIKPGVVHNSEAISRFVQEARISGTLQHPGVVPIHDLGLMDDEKPFLAMKLIDGQTLAKMIEGKTPVNQLLEIFGQICQTLAYVHSRNVVHRDLKPLNIMVGEFGEVQVMDWGLAKTLQNNQPTPKPQTSNTHTRAPESDDSVEMSLDETKRGVDDRDSKVEFDSWQTQSGVIIGTPSYMSPEQALGIVEDIDKRSDVFALGAILCEILTGQPPCGDIPREKVMAFAQKPDYSQLNQKLEQSGHDQQLIQLVQQCLSTQIDHRPLDAKGVSNRVIQWKTSTQDRLREIEVEVAKAEAQAASEKKRRRLTTALLASLAGLVLVAAASIAFFSNQKAKELEAKELRQDKIRENDSQINRFLSSASEKRKLAIEGDSKDPVVWQNVLHKVELANNLVNEDTNTELRSLVGNLQTEIKKQITIAQDDESKEKRLARTMELLALAHHSVADHEHRTVDEIEGRKGVLLFEQAFEAFGIPTESDPKEARIKFVAAPEDVQEAMTFALFEWHLAYRKLNEPGGYYGRWLRTLFEYFDTDKHRFNLRRAYLNDAPDKVLKLLREEKQIGELEFLIAAESLNRNERFDERRELFKEAITVHPNSYWANQYLAEDYAERAPRLLESALRHYYVCAAIDPDNLHSKINIGGLMIKQNQYKPAETYFARLLNIAPANPKIRSNFGAMLMVNGNPKEAIDEFNKALDLNPKLIQAYVNIGEANSMLKDFEAAEKAYQTAIELDPKHPDAYISKANAVMQQGNNDLAMETLDKLFEFAPNHRLGLSTKAEILAGRGELEEAEKTMQKVVELSPEEIGQYINLAFVQQMMEKFDEAAVTLKSAEKLDPTDIRIHNSLLDLYKEMGETEKATATEETIKELKRLKESAQ